MELTKSLLNLRIKEMEQSAKEGKLCGVGALALMIFKAVKAREDDSSIKGSKGT